MIFATFYFADLSYLQMRRFLREHKQTEAERNKTEYMLALLRSNPGLHTWLLCSQPTRRAPYSHATPRDLTASFQTRPPMHPGPT